MIPSIESTRIGLVKPNSKMDAAICAICSAECVRAFLAYGTSRSDSADRAICSAECVRAFLAYGTSRSVGQISMRRAIAGVMVAGIVAIGLQTTTEEACQSPGSPTLDIRLARAGIGHPFAPPGPVSRRLARGWAVGPPAAPGAPWGR